jgi:hypothetical protein
VRSGARAERQPACIYNAASRTNEGKKNECIDKMRQRRFKERNSRLLELVEGKQVSWWRTELNRENMTQLGNKQSEYYATSSRKGCEINIRKDRWADGRENVQPKMRTARGKHKR